MFVDLVQIKEVLLVRFSEREMNLNNENWALSGFCLFLGWFYWLFGFEGFVSECERCNE
jgi:energy-converting hydrogenase Eha subunit G